jgi:hypothetical protein
MNTELYLKSVKDIPDGNYPLLSFIVNFYPTKIDSIDRNINSI